MTSESPDIISSVFVPTLEDKFNAVGGVKLITSGSYPYVELYTLRVNSQGVNITHVRDNPPRYDPGIKHRIRIELFNDSAGIPKVRAFVDGLFLNEAEIDATKLPSRQVVRGHVWIGGYAGEPVGLGIPLEVWMGEAVLLK